MINSYQCKLQQAMKRIQVLIIRPNQILPHPEFALLEACVHQIEMQWS